MNSSTSLPSSISSSTIESSTHSSSSSIPSFTYAKVSLSFIRVENSFISSSINSNYIPPSKLFNLSFNDIIKDID